MRDVRYALRTMRKTPLFACVTILTLGVGIGANTTIFSIVSRFVLRHPPVGDPGTLMALHTTHGGESVLQQLQLAALQRCTRASQVVLRRCRVLRSCCPPPSAAAVNRNASGDRPSPPISSMSRSLAMTARPRFHARGRDTCRSSCSVTGCGSAASAGIPPLWASPSGSPGGHSPWSVSRRRRFRGLDIILDAQFWVPLDNLDQLLPNTANRIDRDYHWLAVAGRLAPGVTQAQAAAELEVLGATPWAKLHPEAEGTAAFAWRRRVRCRRATGPP